MTANPNPTYDTLLDFWRAVRDADQECAELIEFNEAVGEALAAVGASMLHAKPIEQPLPAPPEPPRCPACGQTMIKTTWAMDDGTEAVYVMWMCPDQHTRPGHITEGVLDQP